MATENAQYVPGAGSAAEERYVYMLLHAPGATGEVGEPARGGAWLQEQVRMLAGAVPGPDGGRAAGRLGELAPALEAVLGRGEAEGLMRRDKSGSICLTPRGRRAAERLWDVAGRRPREAALIAKRLFNDMDYGELESFAHFVSTGAEVAPEAARELDGRRFESAIGLTMRHKVTAAKGAEIAGMDTEGFVAELRRRGHEPYSPDGEDLEESLRVIDSIIGR